MCGLNMNFSIRFAAPEDLDSILWIMERACRSVPDPAWFVASDRDFLQDCLAGKGFILLAEGLTGPSGFLVVKYPGDEPGHLGRDAGLPEAELPCCAYMDTVAVLPEARGNRLHIRLLAAAEQALSGSARCHWLATVHPQNRYSLQNFTACSYRVAATRKKYGGLDRHILYKRARLL